MAKKDKKPSPAEKIYSMDEVDEATLKQFNAGRIQGMFLCSNIFYDAFKQLQQSLDDVSAIEYHEVISPEKRAAVDKLIFARSTLSVLEDIFYGKYDEKLERLKFDAGEDVMSFIPEDDDE